MSKFLDMTGLTHFKSKMLNVINNGLSGKVDKVTGKSLISDAEIERLANVVNYDDSGVKDAIQTNADNITTNKTNISTLAKHVKGDLTDSDFQEDTAIAMTKTVLSGMGDYAGIKVIGGYTRKTVNLFDINSAPYITKVDDETFNMVNHTNVVMTGFKANTQYTFSGYAKNNVSGGNVRFRIKYTDGSDTDIIKVDGREYKYRQATSQAGKSISYLIGYYGASGNATFKQFQVQEGSTATAYEPYGQLWNAPVESVVSTSKNLWDFTPNNLSITASGYVIKQLSCSVPAGTYTFSMTPIYTGSDKASNLVLGNSSGTLINKVFNVGETSYTFTLTEEATTVSFYTHVGTYKNIQLEKGSTKTDYTTPFETTLLLPDALKSLPDWGCAVNDEIYNWVDFENMVYHHKVGSVDMSNMVWTKNTADKPLYYADAPTNSKVDGDAICSKFLISKGSNPTVAGQIRVHEPTYNKTYLYTGDNSMGRPEVAEYCKGVMLNYELATEEIIDISDILHPIRVETGGTITFQNEHNLDMPNTVVYKKEVSLS